MSIQLIFAQESTVRPKQAYPQFSSHFTKQNITWNWQTRFQMADSINRVWQWQVQDYFQSNLITPSGTNRQWKDEHTFSGAFSYRQHSFSPGVYVKSWYQSDRQTAIKNIYANHAIGLFLDSKYIRPYVGYQQSINRDITDWGWDTGFRGELPNYHFGIYNTRLGMSSDYDLYEKRRNYDNRLSAAIQTNFSDLSGDSLSFNFSETSKQYYSGNTIEHVKIYSRDWQNRLFYYLSRRDRITLKTKLQSRNISYFNGRNISLLENSMEFRHSGSKLQLAMNLRTGDETQDNAGIKTDSRARQTALRLNADYHFSSRQQAGFDLAYAKLQYDTPDSIVNNDDRDEQRYIFQVNYFYRFSPVLKLSWQAYAYLFHQIYIFKEQSINNSWNRVYKLVPRLDYAYGRLRNSLSTQVLVNYTVYDFENFISQTRSYVFRKYTLSDSISTRLLGNQYLGAHIKMELEDKGSFYSDDFTQQVLQSYRSQFYNLYFLNTHFLYFRAMAGYTYYRRDEWRHIPLKHLSRSIINQGPYLNVAYLAGRKLKFSANISLSTLDDSAYKRTNYTTGYLKLYYSF